MALGGPGDAEEVAGVFSNFLEGNWLAQGRNKCEHSSEHSEHSVRGEAYFGPEPSLSAQRTKGGLFFWEVREMDMTVYDRRIVLCD